MKTNASKFSTAAVVADRSVSEAQKTDVADIHERFDRGAIGKYSDRSVALI